MNDVDQKVGERIRTSAKNIDPLYGVCFLPEKPAFSEYKK
jgi:hypothetical protein